MKKVTRKLVARSNEVIQDYKEGVSWLKLSKKYGACDTTIRKFLNKEYPQVLKHRQMGRKVTGLRKIGKIQGRLTLRLAGRIFSDMGLGSGDYVKVIADSVKILILPVKSNPKV